MSEVKCGAGRKPQFDAMLVACHISGENKWSILYRRAIDDLKGENNQVPSARRNSVGISLKAHCNADPTMPCILVVDDDPLVSSAIRSWLELRGFAVVVADDGISGLNALDRSTFDLMIIDIFMPHLRGFESIRVFHQAAPSVPLIAISGYLPSQPSPTPDFLRMALDLGALRCLRKPFTSTTLLSVIDECLLEAQRLRKGGAEASR